MRKFLFSLVCTFGLMTNASADHITGGEMFYSYGGMSGSNYIYHVTLKLFQRCNSGRMFPNPHTASVFNRKSNQRVTDLTLTLSATETISLASNNPCISNPPVVCYQVAYYRFTVTLPASAEGYIIASQINYRIAGIANLDQSFGFTGATYTAEIPGTDDAPDGMANHSANFTGSDLVIVCADNSMQYSFAAYDGDGDQLIYTFCNAYQSSSTGQGTGPIPNPPYNSVPYAAGFMGTLPLGGYIQINNGNGLITGIAPGPGQYVVTVCVSEIRNGKVIAVQRKDLQINIAPCTIAAASLLPVYMLCKDTRTMTFANNSTSTLINTYNWEVYDSQNNLLYTSAAVNPTYTFPDTGIYKIRLAINRGQQCSDSTTSTVRVYPGFFPDFSFAGVCFGKPTKFTDLSTTVYGSVNSWTWDLGELSAVTNDTSTLQHPTYTYPTGGVKNVVFIATNTKGCKDTVQKLVTIVDKPPLNLLFKDTLICTPDSVKLISEASGIFSWSPNIHMINGNTATPTVAPPVTTKYYVELNDNDCKNRDSVTVRVTDHVNLTAMNDTLICTGDTIRLRTTSDAFRFVWSPASQVLSQSANPFSVTPVNTTYSVTAYIGSCFANESLVVNVAPYPAANAGNDTVLCFGTPAFLRGSSDGTSFSWSPASSLNNSTILNPIAHPVSTTTYILSAFDNKGCPKPGVDAVKVAVLPKIQASAGRDTVAVIGQPLQLEASGGSTYLWSPPIGLSSTSISNPIARYNSETDVIRYRVLVHNEENCVDSAFVEVKVFKTLPSIFVPTAFSPNSDGHNDFLRPIAVGMQKIEYFNVYTRWGQLVYSSIQNSRGWDGRIAGKIQSSQSFVWMVKAVDYKGEPYFQKGTVTLVR